MRTGLTKQEKTTDIWFDEKDPLIHIRTHNPPLKKRFRLKERRTAPPTSAARPTQTRTRAAWSLKSEGAFLFPSDRPIQRGTAGNRGGLPEKTRPLTG